ncbi:hypothetical protein [Streptomyces sp. NPDC048462]|uniref:hypothetical protein n=1 Tax=Streptomyces sp. NPDC048462 TaxID=3365555 RepID=UPI003716D7AF
MQINPRRTTFSFAPPVDNAAAWHLRLDDFATKLTAAFPEAVTWPEGPLGPRGAETLSFEMPLGDGVWLEGLATTPFPELGSVLVEKASADEAAVIAVWLRDVFAPAPDLVHFTSEMALDRGEVTYTALPPHGSVTEVAAALQQHLERADM